MNPLVLVDSLKYLNYGFEKLSSLSKLIHKELIFVKLNENKILAINDNELLRYLSSFAKNQDEIDLFFILFVINEDIEYAKYLIELGADINEYGPDMFHLSLFYTNDERARMLFEMGVNPFKKDTIEYESIKKYTYEEVVELIKK